MKIVKFIQIILYIQKGRNYKNFFLLNNESNADLVKTVGFQEGVNRGEWVSVDNDHVTYANRMQPMLTKYHSYLPNVMQMCV